MRSRARHRRCIGSDTDEDTNDRDEDAEILNAAGVAGFVLAMKKLKSRALWRWREGRLLRRHRDATSSSGRSPLIGTAIEVFVEGVFRRGVIQDVHDEVFSVQYDDDSGRGGERVIAEGCMWRIARGIEIASSESDREEGTDEEEDEEDEDEEDDEEKDDKEEEPSVVVGLLNTDDVMAAWLGVVQNIDIARHPFASAVGGRAFTLVSERWGAALESSVWMRRHLNLLCRSMCDIEVNDGVPPARTRCIVCERMRICVCTRMPDLYGCEVVSIGATCLARCIAARELYAAWNTIRVRGFEQLMCLTDADVACARSEASQLASRFNRALAAFDESMGMDKRYYRRGGHWGYHGTQ